MLKASLAVFLLLQVLPSQTTYGIDAYKGTYTQPNWGGCQTRVDGQQNIYVSTTGLANRACTHQYYGPFSLSTQTTVTAYTDAYKLYPNYGTNDCVYDTGTTPTLFMIAFAPPVSIDMTSQGAYSGFQYLFCDPNSMVTLYPASTTTTSNIGCNGAGSETTDIYYQALSPIDGSMIGLDVFTQFVRYTDGYLFFSNALELVVS